MEVTNIKSLIVTCNKTYLQMCVNLGPWLQIGGGFGLLALMFIVRYHVIGGCGLGLLQCMINMEVIYFSSLIFTCYKNLLTNVRKPWPAVKIYFEVGVFACCSV